MVDKAGVKPVNKLPSPTKPSAVRPPEKELLVRRFTTVTGSTVPPTPVKPLPSPTKAVPERPPEVSQTKPSVNLEGVIVERAITSPVINVAICII